MLPSAFGRFTKAAEFIFESSLRVRLSPLDLRNESRELITAIEQAGETLREPSFALTMGQARERVMRKLDQIHEKIMAARAREAASKKFSICWALNGTSSRLPSHVI